MSIIRNLGLQPKDAIWNDQATAWVQDYDAWLDQGMNCVTVTGHLSPAEWDQWKARYEARGAVLLGIARSLIGAELGDRP